MKRMILHAFLLAALAGCSSSKYDIAEPRPTLALATSTTTCSLGETVNVALAVSQRGVDGLFSLSALLLQGQAVIALDATTIAAAGEWIPLSAQNARMAITPGKVGEAVISLQAKGPDGAISDPQQIRITALPASGITADAVYQARIVNPTAEARIPIRLEIDCPQYTGKYVVTPTVTVGRGRLYGNGYVVNDTQISAEASTTFQYAPEVIGEHIIELAIHAGKTLSVTKKIYIDVVKKISVVSDIEGCFSIEGIGEHDTEGKEITLALINDDGFNFEVAGWYDTAGTLLTGEETCKIKLGRDCITDLRVALKQRTVNITRLGIVSEDKTYLVMQNGKPVVKIATEYRTQFSGDFKASEPINFYYVSSRYDMSQIPPAVREGPARATIDKGATKSTYLWQTVSRLDVAIRPEDNPQMKFNYTDRYVESATTRYHIPANVKMKY